MESWFGVNRWWYDGTVTNKTVAFGNFNPHSNAPRRPQQNGTYKSKRKKRLKGVRFI